MTWFCGTFQGFIPNLESQFHRPLFRMVRYFISNEMDYRTGSLIVMWEACQQYQNVKANLQPRDKFSNKHFNQMQTCTFMGNTLLNNWEYYPLLIVTMTHEMLFLEKSNLFLAQWKVQKHLLMASQWKAVTLFICQLQPLTSDSCVGLSKSIAAAERSWKQLSQQGHTCWGYTYQCCASYL